VGDHLEDVRSDFSVLHRVGELERMPAPRAYALAYRLSAYQGVVAARWRTEQARKTQERASVPREMSAADWLAMHPQHLEKVRRERKG
jgi:hypothetical protein